MSNKGRYKPRTEKEKQRGRRERGSGSCREFVVGGFEWRISYKTADADVKFSKVFQGVGATRPVARRAAEEAMEVWKAEHERPTNETVRQYLARWLRTVEPPFRAYRTWEGYKSRLDLYVMPVIGDVPLAEISVHHVRKVMDNALAKVVKEATETAPALRMHPRGVNLIRAALSVALSDAVREGLIPDNPVRLTRKPIVPPSEVTPLTAAEVRAFLVQCANHPCGPLCILTLSLGLRLGEATGLRWDDWDRTEQALTLRTKLIRKNGGWALESLKGNKTRRLNLPNSASVALMEQWRKGIVDHSDLGLVFLTAHGLPFHPSTVRAQFHRLLIDSALPPKKFHILRHTAASLLGAGGLSLKEAQMMLGHANVAVTAGIYTHIYQEGRQRAADLMEGIIGAGAGSDAATPAPD